jgi:hypothetical protein
MSPDQPSRDGYHRVEMPLSDDSGLPVADHQRRRSFRRRLTLVEGFGVCLVSLLVACSPDASHVVATHTPTAVEAPVSSPSNAPPLSPQTAVMRLQCAGVLLHGTWDIASSDPYVAAADFSNSSTDGPAQNWIYRVRVYAHDPGMLLAPAVGSSPYPSSLWSGTQESVAVAAGKHVRVPIAWPYIDSQGRRVPSARYYVVVSGTVTPPGYPAEVSTCTISLRRARG